MISALRRMALAAIDPRYEEKQRELATLRAAAQSNGGIQPYSWRRIMGSDGGLVGFDFYCCQQYRLLDISLWLRAHQCPHCNAKISVLDACGIKPGDAPETWPEKFLALPVQPQAAVAKPRNFQDTWAVGADEVDYALADPYAVSKQGGK